LTQNSLLNVADFNPSLENLLIENSTLRGTGIITLTGSLDWQGGTIGPATGDLEIQAATLEVSTSGPWSLVNSTLTVTDATEWNSSSTGTFTLTGSSLSLVAGASAVSIPTNLSLNATSHLILEDGSFTLSGYIMSGNGEVRVGSASTTPVVDFSGYIQLGQSSFISGTTRFLPASTILSVGLGETVSVSGGTLELNNGDSISIPNLSLTAGTLTGLDSVTTSNMTWSGGKIACLSSMYVAYLDTGLSYPQLDGCRLTVANSWEGIGNVTLINNAQLILLTSISISSGVTTFSGSGTVSVGTMNLSSGSGITLAGGAELIWSGGSLTGGGAVTIESGSSLSFGYGQCTLQSDLIVFGSATWPTNHPLIIATGGTLDISSGSDQVMDQLDLAGGILQGSDDLTITTSLTWSSGTIGGVGELNLPDTVTLSLDGSGARTLDARALNLDGALNWTGSGNLTLRNGAMLTNQGEMTWTGLGTLYLENNAVLNNQGQLSFQGSAPKTITTHTSGEVVNAGVLSQTGSSTTTIDVAISSTGELSVTGGTLTLNSFSTASADASIAIDSGSALILSSIATASIDGPVTIDTGGMLRFYSGDFTLGSTSSLTGGGMVDFGSVRGSIHGTYNLTGTTRLTSTLSLPVTFTSQSHLLNPGSLIELNGTGFPTLVLDTGQPVTLTNLELKMGTLGGSDSVTVTGQFSWSGGTLSGSGATPPALNLPATAGLVYSGDAPHALNHRILNIAGPTDWSGVGSLHIGVTGRLNNLETAVMTIHHQSPTHLIISEVPAFTNRGKITISNSAGNSILSVPTTNTGTIEVQSGTLQINQDYVQSDGLLKLNGGGLLIGRAGQTLEIDGGRLQAIGNSTIDGHLHNIAGTISLGDLPRTPGKLTITGDYLQGPAGTLELYIQDSVNADLIEVGETAVFDGTLKMNRPSSYVPANGDQVVVMHYVSALGSFTNLEGSDLGSGLYLLPDYQNPIALTLKVTDTPSNLAITLDDGVDTVTPGMSLTYTIMITNNDLTHAAQAIRITGTFPAELANITWECNGPGGSCGSGSGNIDLILASLSAGGSATLTVHAAVAPGASGTINAIVSVACSGITKNAVDQDTISTVSQQKLYLPLTIR